MKNRRQGPGGWFYTLVAAFAIVVSFSVPALTWYLTTK